MSGILSTERLIEFFSICSNFLAKPLRGSQRDNFIVVLARTFKRLEGDVETENRRRVPDEVERVNAQRHAGTVAQVNR